MLFKKSRQGLGKIKQLAVIELALYNMLPLAGRIGCVIGVDTTKPLYIFGYFARCWVYASVVQNLAIVEVLVWVFFPFHPFINCWVLERVAVAPHKFAVRYANNTAVR